MTALQSLLQMFDTIKSKSSRSMVMGLKHPNTTQIPPFSLNVEDDVLSNVQIATDYNINTSTANNQLIFIALKALAYN